MKLIKILAASCLVLQGCSHLKFQEIPEYKLSKSGVFLVSESPELWRFYGRSVFEKERSVHFLVKNTASQEQVLYLSKASIKIGNETSTLSCKDLVIVAPEVKVQGNQVAQIVCPLRVVPTDLNQLSYKDSLARIEIPTGAGTSIVLERLLRIEEFQ